MWTQRDQIQAYQFLRRRLVSALVSADANHPVSSSKRLVLGTALGVAAALLAAAVFGVIGLLAPSRAEAWRQGGQVIIEEETGARFLLGADGALHPVLNYASARLLAGGDGTKTATVPAKSLGGVPRGPGVGISGAPDSLPGSERLLDGPWTRCTRTSPDRPAGDPPVSSVLLGQKPPGNVLRDGQAVLARLGDRLYLITEGQRHRLAGPRAVVALGYASTVATPVAREWLNTVPAGRDLATIDVPDAGSRGPAVGGRDTTVGQVLESGGDHYVVRADGLAVVGETEAWLVLGAPSSAAAYGGATPQPVLVPAAAVAAAPQAATKPVTGYPRHRAEPVPVRRGDTVCASGGEITVGGRPPGGGAEPIVPSAGATQVYVPGGAGAVVEEQPNPGASSGTVYLITDTGRKYPVSGDEALASLGYEKVERHGVPSAVLALFPTSVALSRDAAEGVVPH